VQAGAKKEDLHARIQGAGRNLIVYIYSLMKTGEIHDLNNEAYIRPSDKLIEALDVLLKIERQAVTVVVYEGIAQINSHALWLDQNTQEQATEQEGWLARREAGGIIFSALPTPDEVRRFFYHFARFRAPADAKNQMAALQEHITKEGVQNIKLAPQPLRLEGVGVGVRGVASLWHYAKAGAGMEDVLSKAPPDVKAARRVAQELVDASATEQDLLCALPLLGTSGPQSPARRAVDVAVLVAATARGLGLSAIRCADMTAAALLADAAGAYENPDPSEFTVPELAGVLAVRQLLEATKLTGEHLRRLAVAIEHSLGPTKTGPPYIVAPPKLSPEGQLVAVAEAWLDLVKGSEQRPAISPLEAGLSLLRDPPRHVETSLARVFVAVVGLLPVGTVVEMHNGDVGIVAEVDHLRGRTVYNAEPPPVLRPRKIVVERMRTPQGKAIPERKARSVLGEEAPDGEDWSIKRTLDPGPWRDLIIRGLIRRPSTVVAQMGLR
jgi:hypothetical protein